MTGYKGLKYKKVKWTVILLIFCISFSFPCSIAAASKRSEARSEESAKLERLIQEYEEYEERFSAIETRADIEEYGYTPIEEHSFQVVLETFGEEEQTFLPALENRYHRLALFVLDAEGNVLWKTNQLETNYCLRGELTQPIRGIDAVSFRDMDQDGCKDITIITACENDTGDYAGRSYKIGDVLYQSEGSFYRDWRISDQINRFGMNKSISFITAYARDGRSTEFLYTATTLDELKENGFEIFEQQHYTRNFEKWGRLQIVPGVFSVAEYDIFMIYLVNEAGYIVWSFQPMEDYDSLYAMKGMRCQDLDGDGMRDLLILARFSYIGPDDQRVVDVKCLIYYQRTGSFDIDTEFQNYYQCTEEDKVTDLVTKVHSFWGWETEEND